MVIVHRSAFYGTGHGFAFQMSAAYSAIVRSLENFPEPATFRMALRAQASASAYSSQQPLVRLEIGLQVRQVHVVVAVRQQRVAQRSEDARLVAAEVVGEDQVQRRAGLRLVVVVPVRVVPAAAVGHLLRGQAEQEEVLLARFFGHLDGRAVARAERQRAVHHELHVARAAGLVAGGRDLVGDVAGGISRSASETQYSGRNTTLSRPRTAGSPSIVPARLLMNLMISLASW